jgi:protease-4
VFWSKSSGDKSKTMSESNRPEWRILENVASASIIEQRKARRWGIFFKLLTFGYLLFFILALMPNSKQITQTAYDHVGIVYIDGVIAADTVANANTVVAGLRKAFSSPSSKAVIIAINSPGGSPVQSGYINDEIFRLRDIYPDKPIYAVISDLGASGGYYVASAANSIYADKASLVGSIGVISAGFGFQKFIDDFGIERRVYTSGENKAFLDPFSDVNEKDIDFWKTVLSYTHQQFIDVVKKGRGTRLIDDPKIFSGLVWTGEQALAKGLIDGLGSAGYVGREVIGIDDFVDYTIEPNPFESFVKRIGASFANGVISVMSPNLR